MPSGRVSRSAMIEVEISSSRALLDVPRVEQWRRQGYVEAERFVDGLVEVSFTGPL